MPLYKPGWTVRHGYGSWDKPQDGFAHGELVVSHRTPEQMEEWYGNIVKHKHEIWIPPQGRVMQVQTWVTTDAQGWLPVRDLTSGCFYWIHPLNVCKLCGYIWAVGDEGDKAPNTMRHQEIRGYNVSVFSMAVHRMFDNDWFDNRSLKYHCGSCAVVVEHKMFSRDFITYLALAVSQLYFVQGLELVCNQGRHRSLCLAHVISSLCPHVMLVMDPHLCSRRTPCRPCNHEYVAGKLLARLRKMEELRNPREDATRSEEADRASETS